MSRYREQVAGVLAALELVSPIEYSWFGEPSEPLAPVIARNLSPEASRRFLTHQLQQRLYADFYCRGGAEPGRPSGFDPGIGPAGYVETLSRANGGAGPWEPGWHVDEVDGDDLVVSRGGLRMWAARSECRAPAGGRPAPGQVAEVHLPNEYLHMSPGFYMALGDVPYPEHDVDALVRLYFNLDAEGAVELVSSAGGALDAAHMPFRLKVVADPARYTRCDAAVLYIRSVDVAQCIDALRGPLARLRDRLAPPVPALTKPLAPGVGLAEDPGAGAGSFGQHRCGLLAEAALVAVDEARGSEDAGVEIVARELRRHGVDLDAPYLNPGSTDGYHL